MRILVIEDDSNVADFIVKGLLQNNHSVDYQADGREGLFYATTESYDVIIVDRMLPSIDGLTIVRTLRASEIQIPILILSALGDVEQRIEGLKTGADDYLVKPFSFSELLVRVEILARRSSNKPTKTRLMVADLVLDLLGHKATRQGKEIDLLATEYRILELLMNHAGQVVSRTMLLEHVWDYNFDPQTNVIDVHMSRLRKKIDKPFDKELIQTVRGAGYVIRTP